MVQNAKETDIWPRTILLCGREDFLIDWAKNYIKDAVTNPASLALDYTVFSEDAINAYDIISACETVPLLSSKKLVVVEDCDIFQAQSPKDMSKEEIDALIEYIPKLAETTLLVFTCQKPNKTKGIYKAISKQGIIYDFVPLDDASLVSWMAKRLKANDKSAKPEDLLNFAKNCGYQDSEKSYTLHSLENDLKKVFASTDKKVLSLDDLMESSEPALELNAFKLLDSAFSGNKSEAMTILHNTIESQTPSKEVGAVMSFLGLICSQLEIMVEGTERSDEGQSFYEIASSMGGSEYRLKKALASCKNKSASALRNDLDNAFQIEKDLKSGNIDGRLALELFIAKL